LNPLWKELHPEEKNVTGNSEQSEDAKRLKVGHIYQMIDEGKADI
jgi:hypothetical protein